MSAETEAFLETLHKCNFPVCPIVVGINTGHLGFFQEILPEGIDRFVEDYVTGNYSIRELNTVKCSVSTGCGKTVTYDALNEITIKGRQSRSVHLHISISGKPIHKFSGDSILVAHTAGSTAYNYSLGGSIVDPRLKLLQVTPMAPMNTTAYRSFTSSILLPADLSIGVVPENTDNTIYINYDSIEAIYTDIKKSTSPFRIRLLIWSDSRTTTSGTKSKTSFSKQIPHIIRYGSLCIKENRHIYWMNKTQLRRMKCLTGYKIIVFAAVQLVSQHRMPNMRHMHSYLMRPAGFKRKLYKSMV